MKKLFISFDDGFLDQFKWARALFSYGIKGTFYINPINMDVPGFLKLWQLEKMHNEWGHVIANHLWSHECPALGLTELSVTAEFEATRQWLCDNGFEDGSKHVALPFGSDGGEWTSKYIDLLNELSDSVRDAGKQKLEMKAYSNMLCATETTKIDLNESKICALYFHKCPNLKDTDFLIMLEELAEMDDVEFVTIQEASNVYA